MGSKLSKDQEEFLVTKVLQAKTKRDWAKKDLVDASQAFARAIGTALESGMSVRKLAGRISMSPARVHQIYSSES